MSLRRIFVITSIQKTPHIRPFLNNGIYSRSDKEKSEKFHRAVTALWHCERKCSCLDLKSSHSTAPFGYAQGCG